MGLTVQDVVLLLLQLSEPLGHMCLAPLVAVAVTVVVVVGTLQGTTQQGEHLFNSCSVWLRCMQRLVSVHAAFYVLVSVHAAFMFWFRCMHPPITCTSPPPPSTDRAGMTHACGKVGGRTALDAHKQYTAPLAPPPMAAHLTASEVVLRDWAVAAFSGPDEQHSCEQLSLVATVTARPGVCAAGQGQTWCVCIRGGGHRQGASVCVEGGGGSVAGGQCVRGRRGTGKTSDQWAALIRHQISGQPSSNIRSVGSPHQTSDQWAALIRHQISGQPSACPYPHPSQLSPPSVPLPAHPPIPPFAPPSSPIRLPAPLARSRAWRSFIRDNSNSLLRWWGSVRVCVCVEHVCVALVCVCVLCVVC